MIIEKIKKYGILNSIKIAGWKITNKINVLFYYLCRGFGVDSHLIIFESEGDLTDNSYALFDYMMKTGILKNYKIVWLVDDVEKAKKCGCRNTVYVEKFPKTIHLRRSYYLATCRWFIYDHCNVMDELKKRENCTIINLWHGCGFKAGKGQKIAVKSEPDFMLVTGKIFVDIQASVFGYSKGKFLELGYPRNDYLFHEISTAQNDFKNKWGLYGKRKIFLWMPTFRRSNNASLSEDYFESMTGLPLIDTLSKLEMLNKYLAEQNCLCLFKLHHLQEKLNVFEEKFSNIKVIKDEDIQKMGLQLYEVLPLTDCLISDYSSVTTDYMLLDKPIIYTLDDYEEYRNARGFAVNNPDKYFVGYWTKNLVQFMGALNDVVRGNDPFKKERNTIMTEMHTYIDGKTCERILRYLGIT